MAAAEALRGMEGAEAAAAALAQCRGRGGALGNVHKLWEKWRFHRAKCGKIMHKGKCGKMMISTGKHVEKCGNMWKNDGFTTKKHMDKTEISHDFSMNNEGNMMKNDSFTMRKCWIS